MDLSPLIDGRKVIKTTGLIELGAANFFDGAADLFD
jgi:hypothetical protein